MIALQFHQMNGAIFSPFQDMMAHQSQMANEGANEEDHYWELIWANLVSSNEYI